MQHFILTDDVRDRIAKAIAAAHRAPISEAEIAHVQAHGAPPDRSVQELDLPAGVHICYSVDLVRSAKLRHISIGMVGVPPGRDLVLAVARAFGFEFPHMIAPVFASAGERHTVHLIAPLMVSAGPLSLN